MGKRSVPKRRHNNTGTVSANRAIGRYTVIWHDSLGVKHTKSTFSLTPAGRQLAEAFLADMLRAKQEGLLASTSLSLGGCISSYLSVTNGNVRASTAALRATIFKRLCNLCPALVNTPINEITVFKLDTVYASLSVTPSYLQRIHYIINAALQYAVNKGMLSSNPARRVTLPRVQHRQIQTLTWRQVGSVFLFLHKQKTTAHRLSNNYVLLFRILHGTGARIGEVLALRWSDIDLQNRTIFIHATVSGDNGILIETPKTSNGTRHVPIFSNKTLKMLSACKPSATNEFVFATSTGGRLRYSHVIREWSLIRAATGITATIHVWRHTAATNWLGVKRLPLANVSQMLGHSSPAITLSLYTHAVPYDTASLIKAYNGSVF